MSDANESSRNAWTYVLLCLAAAGPIFQAVNFLSSGLAILSGAYARVALLLVIVAGSSVAASLLVRQTRAGSRVLAHSAGARRAAALLLTIDLALVLALGVAWAVVAHESGPPEPITLPEDAFGIALAPFGEGQVSDVTERSSAAVAQLTRQLEKELRRTGLSRRVALQTIGPVTNVESAVQWADRTGAELVVWGRITPGETDAAIAYWTDTTRWAVSPEISPTDIISASMRGSTVLIGGPEALPHGIQATALVGRAAIHLGEGQKAIEQFDRALAATEELPGDTSALSSVWRRYRGLAHWRLGEMDLARDDLIASLGLDPSASTYTALGNLYFTRGDFAGAIGNYREALAIDPYKIAPYLGTGYAYAALGDLDAAIGQIEQAKRIRPRFSPTYLALGRVYRDRGLVMLARQAFDHCVVLAESDDKLIAAANAELQALSPIPVTLTPSPTATLSATEALAPVMTTTPATASGPTEVVAAPESYVVQANDNLTSIAARFDSTVEAIVKANNLRNANAIYVGQKLIIPAE